MVTHPQIAGHFKIREDMSESLDTIDQLFILPTIKTSHKFGVPVIYINPQDNASEWSQKIRDHGGIVFKFWDRPVNCIAKICKYSEYIEKMK